MSSLCEETTGLPCEEGGSLEFPEGEATIVGVMEPGSSIVYTDPEGETWKHDFTDPHQLIAIGDTFQNTALVIISDRLRYSDQGIEG